MFFWYFKFLLFHCKAFTFRFRNVMSISQFGNGDWRLRHFEGSRCEGQNALATLSILWLLWLACRCLQDDVYHRHHLLSVRRAAVWPQVRFLVVQHRQGPSLIVIAYPVPTAGSNGSRTGHDPLDYCLMKFRILWRSVVCFRTETRRVIRALKLHTVQ